MVSETINICIAGAKEHTPSGKLTGMIIPCPGHNHHQTYELMQMVYTSPTGGYRECVPAIQKNEEQKTNDPARNPFQP